MPQLRLHHRLLQRGALARDRAQAHRGAVPHATTLTGARGHTRPSAKGVDIPNIRHVVLYHLPFSDVEFNQMSGRAGRDGKPAWVHLLYGRGDCSINERILRDMTRRTTTAMAQVYRKLRSLQRDTPDDFFTRGQRRSGRAPPPMRSRRELPARRRAAWPCSASSGSSRRAPRYGGDGTARIMWVRVREERRRWN
ncbi:MAG: helicase-related protein [Adlercreutzia equolifaciens]